MFSLAWNSAERGAAVARADRGRVAAVGVDGAAVELPRALCATIGCAARVAAADRASAGVDAEAAAALVATAAALSVGAARVG
jgi:hypothetical protein